MAAFALFKFTQSLGSAAAFLYSTKLNLYHQLWILGAVSTLATLAFCLVEWNFRSDMATMGKSESKQNIIRIDGNQSTYGTTRSNEARSIERSSSAASDHPPDSIN